MLEWYSLGTHESQSDRAVSRRKGVRTGRVGAPAHQLSKSLRVPHEPLPSQTTPGSTSPCWHDRMPACAGLAQDEYTLRQR